MAAAGGMNITRIRKELAECSKDPETSGITAEPVGGSLKHLTGTLRGPVGTPYEGGIFVVDIHIPDTCVAFDWRVDLGVLLTRYTGAGIHSSHSK